MLGEIFHMSKGKSTQYSAPWCVSQAIRQCFKSNLQISQGDIRKCTELHAKGFGEEHTAANVIQDILHHFEIYSQSIPSGLKVVPTRHMQLRIVLIFLYLFCKVLQFGFDRLE